MPLETSEMKYKWFYLADTNITTTLGSMRVESMNVTECLRLCTEFAYFSCLSVVVHKSDPFYCIFNAENRYSIASLESGVEGLEYFEIIVGK